MKYKRGDHVIKTVGYYFDGFVVSAFTNLKGQSRYAVEMITANGEGLIHIFSESQLEGKPCN